MSTAGKRQSKKTDFAPRVRELPLYVCPAVLYNRGRGGGKYVVSYISVSASRPRPVLPRKKHEISKAAPAFCRGGFVPAVRGQDSHTRACFISNQQNPKTCQNVGIFLDRVFFMG